MPNLQDIRTEVRKITGRYATSQLTDAQIDTYINRFYTLEFPENFKSMKLTKPYVFTTIPNVDTYNFPYQNGLPGDQQGNITVQTPIYCQGYQLRYFQDRTQFYAIWPKYTNVYPVGIGNGTIGPYTGTAQYFPMLRGQVDIFGDLVESAVLITASESGYNLVLQDNPVSGQDYGILYDANGVNSGQINYITGAFTITTANPIPDGVQINAQTIPYQAARPIDVLFFNNQFVFRPVPQNIFQVEMTVSQQPTQMMSNSSSPELDEWYLFIALGAAKLVYTAFPDPAGLEYCMKLFQEQKEIAQRRTLKQISGTQRAQTIYSSPRRGGASFPGWTLPGAN